ncbi:MAG: hypothetical protein GY717_08205 [Rhodobacteraceae bacterium]|nr:hypothetical protein [Paracoccaceae bacterium]
MSRISAPRSGLHRACDVSFVSAAGRATNPQATLAEAEHAVDILPLAA